MAGLRVFMDILTPKQCMLFSLLSERLERAGHEVLRTTRQYQEVVQLLRLKGVDAEVVGRHGGGALLGKLEASADRILRLASLVKDWGPDVAVSFSSPEAARVAFGLGVPHVCVSDSPHAEAVARLTVPLSERLLTPMVIPKGAWTRFGIPADRIIQYNALDPWAWLRDFAPDRALLKDLGLDESRPIVTFRAEESLAAYLMGRTAKVPTILPIIRALMRASPDLQVVAIPRYGQQTDALKRALGKGVLVCESVVDGPSLLSQTSVFVGAGGTMTAEAALLGVPTFSCYPGTPFLIEDYLVSRRLVVRETRPEEAAARILETLRNLETARAEQRARARRLTRHFEDPNEVIADAIVDVARAPADPNGP